MTDERSSLVSGEVNNTTLVMGITTSGKSSLVATLAEYAYKKYGRTTFLYTCDGGGYPSRVQALIHKGVIKVFRMRTRSGKDDALALDTTIKASKGWWPAKIHPISGVTDPNVPMVPPVIKDAQGEWKINRGFETRGVVVFEGLTSMSKWWEEDLAARQGRLELQGEKGAIGGIVVSGDIRIGGGNRAHVGFSQRRAHQVVHNAQGIPNLVLPPVFTALTTEVLEEGLLKIVGPKLSGMAATDESPQWFGNVLETRMIRDDDGKRVYRLYLSEFVEEGRRHLCRNRAEPGTMPEYLTDPAPEASKTANGELVYRYQQAFSQFNLGLFFELLEGALEQTMSRVEGDAAFGTTRITDDTEESF